MEPKKPIIYILKDLDELFSFMYRFYKNIFIFDILFYWRKPFHLILLKAFLVAIFAVYKFQLIIFRHWTLFYKSPNTNT